MKTLLAESLASEINAGTYLPTQLNSCDPALPIDRNSHILKFTEFTLFTEPQVQVSDETRYLSIVRQETKQRVSATAQKVSQKSSRPSTKSVATASVSSAEYLTPHPLVALCATYEQIWEPRGYTRGELVSSLTLAPGERLTLEIHSWDKSTRKSEDELATESEMRTSEKLTQRDALTVIQEYSKQRNTNVSANGTIPIPKMPVKVSASSSTQTNERLNNTRETLREQTIDASNTLKVNRKTRIEVSREVGREEKQTRVIENTNRCHSVNCTYFEVMANYLVTTGLVSVQPCLLLPNPRPAMTLDWVLCHEGILIESLIDRIFLPGFEAAKSLKVQRIMDELEARARLREVQELGEQARPYIAAIRGSYHLLIAARDAVQATIQDDQFDAPEYPTQVQRTVFWFSLSSTAREAIITLETDINGGRDPSDALRAFLSTANQTTFTEPVSRDEIILNLIDFFRMDWDELQKYLAPGLWRDASNLDDANLRAAIRSAGDVLKAVPSDLSLDRQESISNRELADAQVEFERLQCHLQENWLHYAQALWLREDHSQRFMRLQQYYGPIATSIENELLGFYGDRAAYPLRDIKAVPELPLEEIIKGADEEIQTEHTPMLITLPTPGLVLEATVGQCDACEDFIDNSRVIELRQQEAKARQEEAEAGRREARLVATPPDLSDPHPTAPAEIRVTIAIADEKVKSP